MNEKQKKIIIIIAIILVILIISLIIIFKGKEEKPGLIGNIDNIIETDIKKDNEKGIVLTNLNSYFVTKEGEKTKPFMYQFMLNGKQETLKFDNIILNNSDKLAKITMNMNDKNIDILDIIEQASLKKPNSITPKFYILGEKDDEVLVLEVIINEETPSIVYMAINNEGEVRNSFGGYDNQKISEDEFLKAIKNGTLIYDHRISLQDEKTYCDCNNSKSDNWLNKVISERKTFSVLEASLKLEKDSLYECSQYCK